MSLVWKKYQIFTKAAEQFIKKIEKMQAASPTDRGSAAL
jgi:cytochrome c556